MEQLDDGEEVQYAGETVLADDNFEFGTIESLINEVYGEVFEKALITEIAAVAKLVEFREGDVLIDVEKYIKSMPY